MKRVGVKYCGGCNPTYDRVKRVEMLVGALKEGIEVVSYEEAPFELLLIVNGCQKACVDREAVRSLCPNYIAIEENAEELEEKLITMIEEDKG
jgi:hypothetical protein